MGPSRWRAASRAGWWTPSALEPKGQELSEAEKARARSASASPPAAWSSTSGTRTAAGSWCPPAGDLFLAEAATGAVTQLTRTPGGETDGRFSPQGRYVSYVRDQNLYVNDLAGGGERALTTAGKDLISYGVAEFVAQEEMARFTGYWWAPDDARIAYTRVDETGVDLIPRLDITAEGSTTVEQRYPRARGGRTRWCSSTSPRWRAGRSVRVDLGADADVYLARV